MLTVSFQPDMCFIASTPVRAYACLMDFCLIDLSYWLELQNSQVTPFIMVTLFW